MNMPSWGLEPELESFPILYILFEVNLDRWVVIPGRQSSPEGHLSLQLYPGNHEQHLCKE